MSKETSVKDIEDEMSFEREGELDGGLSVSAGARENPGEHPLLNRLRAARDGSPRRQVIAGATLPVHAFRLLLGNLKLAPLLIIPVLINTVLFAVSAYFFITHADAVLEWLWAKPADSGVLEQVTLVLWYVLYVLAILFSVAISYVIVLMIGGIVASPFHDILSEATERLLLGGQVREDGAEESGFSLLLEALRSVWSNVVIAGSYFALLIPILLLNFIPLVGTVLATALGMLLSAYFVAMEYCDPLLERRATPRKQKSGLIREHIWFAGAFGLGTNFLLLVPLLNFLLMPIAVMGGTALGIVLLEDEAEVRDRG